MTQGFSNARIVLEDVVLHGAVLLGAGGNIADILEETSPILGTEDCTGDFLLPGFVDVHTDNLERQVQPRSHVRWPSPSAFLAHDAQCAAMGITTVANALCVGDAGFESGRIQTLKNAVVDLSALDASGSLRADHVLHLRCELSAPNMQELFEAVMDHAKLQMVSLMDHTPGVGQYANLEKFRKSRRDEGYSSEELEGMIVEAQARRHAHSEKNRGYLLEQLQYSSLALASHDDRTEAEVLRNAQDGIKVAEFPVSMEAARTARQHGMAIVVGAPNVVRGGSHSGNVAVSDLVKARCVDVLASDYVPNALCEAPFRLVDDGLLALPEAVRMITAAPARILGLPDRGTIRVGLRGDLVRIRLMDGHPIVRSVWKAGQRIA
ncbi:MULTISPECIES: alpha-D-ribose 1-methylphosphonate 5-triphosphate diphosphatase [Acidithiobacillus]|uniref:Alpha-D-ribose 1-methylphosphonate 5-triphosphate diphosphatase n=1 Tax=Acidithiobacillus ferruginosus TaxID=3063951 RepID=A0ACD5IGC5_9PROT|nr:alpha-D-ribose 1-methylphosphonate 5-triphosphate diphosphatase [Acidithiobacillus ferruginosus]MBU2815717.1 alpha-D-ribose 1-methylphosphonate 5-triphosphate diphosphatase [Acidithiobacillus ferruginosus]